MDIDDVTAELGILMTRMQNEPEDRHEIYLTVMEKLNEMKAFGMPLPEDLVKLEAALEAEFAADMRGGNDKG
ncbi:MAG TPA: hypothetical protein P5114_06700 [Hyphomicrobiaceae bacterium]|nr:hypothetical protein [Hyphomicrobiaceae bacterium]